MEIPAIETSVLVLIDFQERLVRAMDGMEPVLNRAQLLLDGAAALKLDAIVTEQYPKGLGATVPEVAEHLPMTAPIVAKTAFSAFGEPAFRSVLESEYSFLEKGQEVKVLPFAGSGSPVRGRISSINPKVGDNGLVSVEAVIPGDGRLIDGMNVKVTVERVLSRQLTVPKSAVVVRDNLDVLFRYNDGKAEWVYVNILNANSESYVVEANSDRGATLSEGEQVIVSGNLNLADGSDVALNE